MRLSGTLSIVKTELHGGLFLVVKTIFSMFFPLENKILIVTPTRNFLYVGNLVPRAFSGSLGAEPGKALGTMF